MNQTILNINETYEVNDYPYGRLRTKAFFSIEFKTGKGFRSVFQTINPKNGQLNAPKKSTYSPFLCLFRNEENGHINEKGFGISGFDAVNPCCQFLAKHFDALQLKSEMITDIYGTLFSMLRVNAQYTSADSEKLWKVLEPTAELLVHGIKTGENIFGQINLDATEIKTLEDEYREQRA